MTKEGSYIIGWIADKDLGDELDFKEDKFIVEGIVHEECEKCVLLEKQKIYQKHIQDGVSLADYFDTKFEHGTDVISKSFLVIVFGSIRNEAFAFDDFEEAKEFYKENSEED